MDTMAINELLHNNQSEHYRIKVGESFVINLPKIPLTGDTEFIRLTVDSEKSDCVEEYTGKDSGEGILSPVEIKGKGVKAGKKQYTIKLVNALTAKEIENVIPLKISLEVEDSD
ncbi:hypothetical protein QQ020_14400 [Fulvivirgaceae bacterium BMA12]|uniref:Uncharacterized protein n=1 Tax=Agaribacillus aureus TaxID=3051825 RepID=A0ABT8L7Q8_9BACT|nr:hypothetical protein [Fulvivirgaceae bacterium BMA12]